MKNNLYKTSAGTSAFALGLVGLLSASFVVGCGDTTACTDCSAPVPTWTTLITGDWTLDAGTEKSGDLYMKVIDRDMYISGLRPISPIGTHHTGLALSLDDWKRASFVYASGVGTNELFFPKGVGIKIPAGQTIVLDLHVFNASTETLAGTSGIEVIEANAADIEYEADALMAGSDTFVIPPYQKLTDTSTCTVHQPQHVFAIFPHMHVLGKHLKSTLTIGGVSTVLYDEDYAFDNQKYFSFDPIAMGPGDTITTECSWESLRPESVKWGNSTNTEMCFGALLRYPAVDDPTAVCQQ